MAETFRLQLLHAADQEAGVPALQDAPNFSAVLNALANEDANNDNIADYANTIRLSSGDAVIPGVFFTASEAVFGAPGRGDILIQNELGWAAIALGNHEFDLGTEVLANMIAADADADYVGALFPYLSANLDFSTDAFLGELEVDGGAAPQAGTVTSSVVIDVNGEMIGVVGATTPTLASISSPGDVGVNPPRLDDGTVDYEALAAIIQEEVDALIADNAGLNKVILLAHMQQIQIELEELAPRLSNVDIIQAGGSNSILVDENDRLRSGDEPDGTYPTFVNDKDGNPTAVVNTDGNYRYVGRLVIDFDENGVIIPESYDPDVSGAYATDDEGVAALGAEYLVDPEIQAIVDALEEEIVALDSNFFGVTDVYLNGLRGEVRTQETNLGNLTADANLAYAKDIDPTVTVSHKNGGGIRDDIGLVETQPGATEPVRLPPPGNELTGKPDGGISQLDLQNSLRFNNGLTLLTVTPEQLLQVLEHAVAGTEPGATPGQFGQFGGIAFSYDADLPVGERVLSAALIDDNGVPTRALVEDGDVVEDAPQAIRMVTLNFLADGGDDYPFPEFIEANPEFANVVQLTADDEAERTGAATFAADGSEQDALAEYLAANFSEENPFSDADTPMSEDLRIQNVDARDDTVLEGVNTDGGDVVEGDGEELVGSGQSDVIMAADGNTTVRPGTGNDEIQLGDNDHRISGSVNDLLGDTVSGFGEGDGIFFEGVQIDSDMFRVESGSAIISIEVDGRTVQGLDGTTLTLEGDFSNGGFLSSSNDAGTALAFVENMPTLEEGEAVDDGEINGVTFADYLVGDGARSYTFTLENAVSAFENTFGTFEVNQNGTVSNVQVLGANSLDVDAGTSFDLGTPGAGSSIGIFLVQNGANALSAPSEFGFNAGDDNILTLDDLRDMDHGAPVFYSLDELNPGGEAQVLTGLNDAGTGLRFGFEDIDVGGGADNDYQDIVFSIAASDATAIA